MRYVPRAVNPPTKLKKTGNRKIHQDMGPARQPVAVDETPLFKTCHPWNVLLLFLKDVCLSYF